MAYKIGDKFIFEIDRIYSSKKHAESRYGFKGFANFVLDKRKLDDLMKHGNIKRLEKHDAEVLKDVQSSTEADKTVAYQDGLKAAWKAAEQIFCRFSEDDMCKIFGFELDETLFENVHPQEAILTLDMYRSMRDEIHFGDEVEAWDSAGADGKWVKFIAVGDIGDGTITGFDAYGGAYYYPKSDCRKTGRKWRVVEDD